MSINNLPDKWYIVVSTDNLELCNKWFRRKSQPKWHWATLEPGDFVLSEHPLDSSHYTKDRQFLSTYSEYKEITTKDLQLLLYPEGVGEQLQFMTRENFQELYDTATRVWKDRLQSWVSKQGFFEKKYSLTSSQIIKMYDAANDEQLEILNRDLYRPIFESSVRLTDSKIHTYWGVINNPITKVRTDLDIISVAGLEHRQNSHISYKLSKYFTWNLVDSNGDQLLIPTLKDRLF